MTNSDKAPSPPAAPTAAEIRRRSDEWAGRHAAAAKAQAAIQEFKQETADATRERSERRHLAWLEEARKTERWHRQVALRVAAKIGASRRRVSRLGVALTGIALALVAYLILTGRIDVAGLMEQVGASGEMGSAAATSFLMPRAADGR